MPSYLRVFVVLVERHDDFPHSHEKYHWHLMIENEGDRSLWQQCHTLETTRSLNGGPEDFEDVPYVGPSININIVKGSFVEVAKFDPAKRSRLITKLRDASQVVNKQRERQKTCKFFVEAMLPIFHKNRDYFGIFDLKSFRHVKETYVKQGLLEAEAPVEVPSPPEMPSDSEKVLKPRKSLFGIRLLKDTTSVPKADSSPEPETRISISRPMPIDPRSLPTPLSTTPPHQQGDELHYSMFKVKTEKELSNSRFGWSDKVRHGSLISNTNVEPRRRASENPQSHRQRMAQSLGLGKRRSSPT